MVGVSVRDSIRQLARDNGWAVLCTVSDRAASVCRPHRDGVEYLSLGFSPRGNLIRVVHTTPEGGKVYRTPGGKRRIVEEILTSEQVAPQTEGDHT
jgi:hypothetical protein